MVSANTDIVLPVIMADTDALLPAANPVLDNARGSEQAKHQREVAVAELVLGDDLDILGGTAPIANFQQLASTDTCGKMAALQKLLALWHENGGNKVRLKGRGGLNLSCCFQDVNAAAQRSQIPPGLVALKPLL